MAKKVEMQVRSPKRADVDSFIKSGVPSAPESPDLELVPAPKETKSKSPNKANDGRVQKTFYIDGAAARKLKAYCALNDLEMSDTVSSLIEKFLSSKPGFGK